MRVLIINKFLYPNVVIVDANVADILGDLHQAKPPR